MSIEVYRSLETDIRWKASLPCLVLTAGITNAVSIKLKENPAAGDVPTEAGRLTLTIRQIPDLSTALLKIEDIIVSGDSSTVDFNIALPNEFRRGYYKGLLIKENTEGVKSAVYDIWVIVDKAIEPLGNNPYMDLESVRAQFADICEMDNKMLDSLEIGAGDIAAAVNRCLEQWKSIAPRVSSYTGTTFPYVELLRNGVLYMLLQSLWTLLARNRMQYNAGGTTVDLESRMEAFGALKQEYEQKWRTGMAQIKAEENMMNFDGTLIYQ